MIRGQLGRSVGGRAVALALLGSGGGLVAASTGVGDTASIPPDGPIALSSTGGPASAPAAVAAQVRLAQARLTVNSRLSHPGRPEVLTHADADHMMAGAPGTPIAGSPGVRLVASLEPASVATGGDARGLDVSSFQGNVDWAGVAADGGTFAYMKATEGTYYTDSTYFAQQYNGSYGAGLVRGAYHFAIPNNSGGAAQADYFVAHGGGWSPDGHTLPGTLDIEYNPYGSECYGLSAPQMVSWIQAFDTEYELLTHRWPTIYTTAGWWSACTGNSGAFSGEGLAVANYSSSPLPLPASWSAYDIWQYADSGTFPGDEDVFNGTYASLVDFAYGSGVIASSVPLACGTAGDLRTPTDASVRPGVVVTSGGVYQTDTIASGGGLQPIPTSVGSAATPLVAVWQNSTDCTGAPLSRNAWAVGPTGIVYPEATGSGPAAANLGDASNLALAKPVVGMSPTSDANGYWLVASDGGIFSYGDAHFFGSTGGLRLVKPIVGMATTPDSAGYWMVASDGGIFAYGDARYYGSLGGLKLVQPIEAMVATPDGRGYWMVASDGGVFCFGDAIFRGSMGGQPLSAPIAGMVPDGNGYTLIGQDGRTYSFA